MLRRKFVNILIPLFLLFIILLFSLFLRKTSNYELEYTIYTVTSEPISTPIQITKTLVPTIQIEIQSFGIVEVDNLNLRECPGIDCKIIQTLQAGDSFEIATIETVEIDNSIWLCNFETNCANSKFMRIVNSEDLK